MLHVLKRLGLVKIWTLEFIKYVVLMFFKLNAVHLRRCKNLSPLYNGQIGKLNRTDLLNSDPVKTAKINCQVNSTTDNC